VECEDRMGWHVGLEASGYCARMRASDPSSLWTQSIASSGPSVG
jgi:hypothetical protein